MWLHFWFITTDSFQVSRLFFCPTSVQADKKAGEPLLYDGGEDQTMQPLTQEPSYQSHSPTPIKTKVTHPFLHLRWWTGLGAFSTHSQKRHYVSNKYLHTLLGGVWHHLSWHQTSLGWEWGRSWSHPPWSNHKPLNSQLLQSPYCT